MSATETILETLDKAKEHISDARKDAAGKATDRSLNHLVQAVSRQIGRAHV